MNRYDLFIKRIRKKYKCTRKVAENGLKQAYITYLSIDELEPFIKNQKGGKRR